MNVIMVLTLYLMFCSSCSSTTAVKSIPRWLLSTILNSFANIFLTISRLQLQIIEGKEVPFRYMLVYEYTKSVLWCSTSSEILNIYNGILQSCFGLSKASLFRSEDSKLRSNDVSEPPGWRLSDHGYSNHRLTTINNTKLRDTGVLARYSWATLLCCFCQSVLGMEVCFP